ncbi:hypothetical protein CRM22_001364 [Opisthorchis felineus]|uniref:Peptidase A1 domain-containing protein n=1 Tax=Opisthorchis felineus TaxID=147828 RepID=A0A4S2MGZ7_OPIFE|nr:hypothetical protein CRM22_001364 [Opisthorchis felineus]TGZ73699.1 hypothetical protein CRM22_001364 [Opisthorchis felineus]
MKEATLISVALFALTIHAFELDLYYRNKGRFREKRDIVYADLSMGEGSVLIAHISLGTPAQNFCVVVDTSLDVTVLLSSTANHADWDQKRKYDRSSSTTEEVVAINIYSRNVRGLGIKDAFQLDGRPVGRLSFSLLTAYNPNARLPALGDGYLGLGHPDVERTVTDFNVLNVMSADQMVDYKRFTLLCVCATHRNALEPDARIVFGSHHTINPGEFHMMTADISRATWKFQVSRLSTPVRLISSRSFTATLDSTTWLNKASVDRARRINTALGATLSGDVYVVDCNRIGELLTLVFTAQGAELSLTPQQYIQKDEFQGETRCFSSIVPDPTIRTERMVLGMTFMEHFITMFDQQEKQLGFKPRVC